MLSLSLPTSITKLGKALNTKLEEFAETSLEKSEAIKEANQLELRIWKEQHNAKLDLKIQEHLSTKKLPEAQQAAVDAWKAGK